MMWRMGWITMLAAALGTGAAEFKIADDGMSVVDGERTFIIGLYENPESDEVLSSVAEAGFNLVHATESDEALDRLQNHGMWGWINTGSRIDLQEDREAREAALREMVDRFGNHPALILWEVPDEALWNCWYSATLWRKGEEARLQHERIDALDDEGLAASLRAKVDEGQELHRAGEHARGEQLADEVWAALGEEQPRPGLNLSNAAERAAAMAAGMREGHALLRSLDPNHPVCMNHAPRNQIGQLMAFSEAADIIACDIYPVPCSEHNGHSDLALKSVACVGAYTDRMQAAAPGKPVWMVLQGFGWSDIQPEREDFMRRPNFDETRFMAYDAIAHGARGIVYWGTFSIEKDSGFWNDLLALAREIDELQPVLSAPDARLRLHTSHAETWGSVDLQVNVLGKRVGDAIWILAVNDWHEPLRYTIHNLQGLDGQRYRVRSSGEEATVEAESLSLLIPGHGVHVLEPVAD